MVSFVSYAQTQGKIVDAQTKFPISFATVSYKIDSDTKGVVADVQGESSIPHKNIQQITVSCLGYKNSNHLIIENESNYHRIII